MNTHEGRWLNGRPHALNCQCGSCTEQTRFSETRVTHDAPTSSLHAHEVSLRELVGNATVTRSPRYEIGEDWNDD